MYYIYYIYIYIYMHKYRKLNIHVPTSDIFRFYFPVILSRNDNGKRHYVHNINSFIILMIEMGKLLNDCLVYLNHFNRYGKVLAFSAFS